MLVACLGVLGAYDNITDLTPEAHAHVITNVFDKDTGEVLWEYQLPAGGYATPSVYQVDGRQFVVIAAGGGKPGTKPGDSYLAFALPD